MDSDGWLGVLGKKRANQYRMLGSLESSSFSTNRELDLPRCEQVRPEMLKHKGDMFSTKGEEDKATHTPRTSQQRVEVHGSGVL